MSYLTYMDFWIISCILFIFSSIVIIVTCAALIKTGKAILSHQIEFLAILLYPFFFLVLNLIFWTLLFVSYYSAREEKNHNSDQ